MLTGRQYNKSITSNTGEGLGNSAAETVRQVELMKVEASTSGSTKYEGESDSIKTMSGAGGGDNVTSPSTPNPEKWGHTAGSGSRIEIDDTAGGEKITVLHHSGAGFVIDPDGGVYVTSTSQRGGGVGAPFGDFFVTASGDITINGGSSVTIETTGDLNLNVGGSLNIKCSAFNLDTDVLEQNVDGHAVYTVTNDQNTIIGGNKRDTIAGDFRDQITGSRITDIKGSRTTRVDGDENYNIGGKNSLKIKGDHIDSVGGKSEHRSSGDYLIDSKGSINEKASSQINMDSASLFSVETGTFNAVASGIMSLLSEGKWTGGSSVETELTGEDTIISGKETVEIHAGTELKALSVTTVVGGLESVTIATPMLIAPVPSGSPPPEGPSPRELDPDSSPESPSDPESPAPAEVTDANDIIDHLTSVRKHPEYPANAAKQSANAAGLGLISGDEMPGAQGAYDEYASGNNGNANPSYAGDSVASMPEQPYNRDPNIEPVDPNISVPSARETGVKVSKYFTLGHLVNAKEGRNRPSPSLWEPVVQQGIMLANNVLDPIKEKFPDILITSWYRAGTKNHGTGRAVDIVVESRSLTAHAEIARYARDNLPVDQVFLERNNSGRTHVHLRVSNGKGNPQVITCSDPKCESKTPGIDVQYLVRKGVK